MKFCTASFIYTFVKGLTKVQLCKELNFKQGMNLEELTHFHPMILVSV